MEYIKEKNNFIKIQLFIVCFSLFFKLLIKNKEDKNSLEDCFTQILCKYFHFERNYNCYNNLFNNMHIYDDIIEINQNIELMLNIKKTTIENIFLLIGIFPFLKNNSTITFTIKDKKIYKLFKSIYKNKKFKRNIRINKYDFHLFNKKFNELIYLHLFETIWKNIRPIISTNEIS